jgi:hypothetical protein
MSNLNSDLIFSMNKTLWQVSHSGAHKFFFMDSQSLFLNLQAPFL